MKFWTKLTIFRGNKQAKANASTQPETLRNTEQSAYSRQQSRNGMRQPPIQLHPIIWRQPKPYEPMGMLYYKIIVFFCPLSCIPSLGLPF